MSDPEYTYTPPPPEERKIERFYRKTQEEITLEKHYLLRKLDSYAEAFKNKDLWVGVAGFVAGSLGNVFTASIELYKGSNVFWIFWFVLWATITLSSLNWLIKTLQSRKKYLTQTPEKLYEELKEGAVLYELKQVSMIEKTTHVSEWQLPISENNSS